jgi:hypothetical protein
VRGAERQRAWSEGCSLHAGDVIAEHDRDCSRTARRTPEDIAEASDGVGASPDASMAPDDSLPWSTLDDAFAAAKGLRGDTPGPAHCIDYNQETRCAVMDLRHKHYFLRTNTTEAILSTSTVRRA